MRRLLQLLREWRSRPFTVSKVTGAVGSALFLIFVVRTAGMLVPSRPRTIALLREAMSGVGVKDPQVTFDNVLFPELSAWCFLGAGLLLMPAARAVQRWLREAEERKGCRQETGGARRWWWMGRVLWVGGFLGTVWVLKSIDVFWRDYEKAGWTVIGYSLGRLMLAGYMMVLCFTGGAWVLKRVFRGFRREEMGDVGYGVVSFFVGATAYGAGVTVLGLVGWLSVPVALGLTVPVLLLGPGEVGEWARSVWGRIRAGVVRQDGLGLGLHFLLGWGVVATGGLLLVTKGLYPGAGDGDTWEHYLHYYREVLRSGSVGPNEVWYHFYLSKGAGLFYLSGLLSDALSAQVVSWCFIMVTGVIVFDLLRRWLGSTAWGMVGAVVFFGGVAADESAGAFFKHHAVLTGYVAFLVWVSARMVPLGQAQRKVVFWSGVAAATYIGFYQPVPTALIAGFLGTLTLLTVLTPGTRKAARTFAALGAASGLGVAGALLMSYCITGMPNDVPIRFFWRLSDRGQFERVFGISGPPTFLYLNNFVSPDSEWTGAWLRRAFRLKYFRFVVSPVLGLLALIAVIVKIFRTDRAAAARYAYPLGLLIAFLLPAAILAQCVQVESTIRVYLFAGFFMTIGGVVLLSAAMENCVPHVVKPWCCGLFAVILNAAVMQEAVRGIGMAHMQSSALYLLGARSLSDVLRTSSRLAGEPAKFDFVTRVRSHVGPSERIMTFGHVQDPAYAFPGRGLISEPTYTMGPHYLEMVFGTPEQAVRALQDRGINYFHVSLVERLYSGVTFSHLFSVDNMGLYFKPVLHEGDQYLLTWRRPGDTDPLPSSFTLLWELKTRGVLAYAASEEFSEGVESAVKTTLRTWPECPQQRTCAELSQAVLVLLTRGMVGCPTLEENKILVSGLVSNVTRELRQEVEGCWLRAQATAQLSAVTRATLQEAFTVALATETATTVRLLVTKECVERFGARLAKVLTQFDERHPFGDVCRSKDQFERVLDGVCCFERRAKLK